MRVAEKLRRDRAFVPVAAADRTERDYSSERHDLMSNRDDDNRDDPATGV